MSIELLSVTYRATCDVKASSYCQITYGRPVKLDLDADGTEPPTILDAQDVLQDAGWAVHEDGRLECQACQGVTVGVTLEGATDG